MTLKMNHVPACFQLGNRSCSSNVSLRDEGYAEHFWSGYPNAFCLKCGMRDCDELCLAHECKCHCHDEFWANFGARRVLTPNGVEFKEGTLGFSVINPAIRKATASRGGKSTRKLRHGHEYNSKTGQAAGKIGGKSLYEKYGAGYMARIGRRGGKNGSQKKKEKKMTEIEWRVSEWAGLALSFGDKFRDLFYGLGEEINEFNG